MSELGDGGTPAVSASGTTVGMADMIAGIAIDPRTRTVRAVLLPAVPRACGCCAEADHRAIGALVGSRWQKAWGILDCTECHGGEVLVVGAHPRGIRWRWGTAEMRGSGLVLRMIGTPGDWALVDSDVSVAQVMEWVSWAPRRSRTQGEKNDAQQAA
jgi:hypothetical protein